MQIKNSGYQPELGGMTYIPNTSKLAIILAECYFIHYHINIKILLSNDKGIRFNNYIQLTMPVAFYPPFDITKPARSVCKLSRMLHKCIMNILIPADKYHQIRSNIHTEYVPILLVQRHKFYVSLSTHSDELNQISYKR